MKEVLLTENTLDKNLVYYRKLSGLTQQQVADQLYLSRSTYTKYENGVSEPSLSVLCKITDLFQVDYNTLLNYSISGVPTALIKFSPEIRNLIKKYIRLQADDRIEIHKLLNNMLCY